MEGGGKEAERRERKEEWSEGGRKKSGENIEIVKVDKSEGECSILFPRSSYLLLCSSTDVDVQHRCN